MEGADRPEVVLVTGGARSGKSRHAEALALRRPDPAYVATAEAMDAEMAERIRRHREERGDRFVTVEEPQRLARALAGLPAGCGVAVVDCLTVWLGNLLHAAERGGAELSARPDDHPEVAALLALLDSPPRDLVLVTNEVGWGVVPATPLGRVFRDLAGRVNQAVAARADRVVLLVSGVPMTVKGAAATGVAGRGAERAKAEEGGGG